MQLILLAVLNTALALVLWIFGAYGLTAGIFASSASGLVMLSVLFVWGSVMGWKNKELSDKVRKKRRVLRNKVFKKIFPYNVLYSIYASHEPMKSDLFSLYETVPLRALSCEF